MVTVGILANGQDTLTPQRFNLNIAKPKTTLTPRAGEDLVYKEYNFDPVFLPFFDEFTTNKGIPKDKVPFYLGRAFYTGRCVPTFGYELSSKDYVKNPSYNYFWNAAKNGMDSTLTTAIIAYFYNDSPDCKTISRTELYYPATCRPTGYNSSGQAIDSICNKDTTIFGALIDQYRFKGVLWTDEYAYRNTHYPVMPPSKYVMTLDALNEKGRPYKPDIFDAYGRADQLTSSLIDLSPFSDIDSIYLSFHYQAQGFGDWPDRQDSLVVQFLDDQGKWNQVWRQVGLQSAKPISTLKFDLAMVKLPRQNILSDPNYYHDSFQFRFVSYGTLTGNNDHWHIDYVELDTARSAADTALRDFTFAYELSSILKNFTLLPSKHYTGIQDLNDTIWAVNNNFVNNPILGTVNTTCKYLNTNTSLFSNLGIPYNTNPTVLFEVTPKANFGLPNPMPDSSDFEYKVYIDGSDNVLTNDSALGRLLFHKEMAYDDGTAEMAYGIKGFGTKKVAYKFKLAAIDTLAAIKILFSNIDEDVRNMVFNLNIWSSIALDSGKKEIVLQTISNKKPYYYDTLNHFHTFYLDTPLTVSDSIYVGWTQADERPLQIGYDRNSELGLPNTAIFVNNVWSKSNVVTPGSPMIRLILDGRYKGAIASVEQFQKPKSESIVVFPNPANEFIQIETENNSQRMNIEIYNLLGQSILRQTLDLDRKVDIGHIQSGLYIINVNRGGEVVSSQKLSIIR
jgi:hypothetical protein